MKSKKINWEAPEPVVERFDEIVTRRWGKKGKWIGAMAAMLMYIEAEEDQREEYGVLAASARGAPELPKKVLAKMATRVHGIPDDEEQV